MKIAIGGTFNNLNENRRKMLKSAIYKLLKSQDDFKVLEIYLLLNNCDIMKNEDAEPWNVRRDAIKNYTDSLTKDIEIAFYRLSDVWGNSLVDENLDSILCFPDKKHICVKINEYRVIKNLERIKISVVKRTTVV
jgi:phosphopantetheine adenylyltransferase